MFSPPAPWRSLAASAAAFAVFCLVALALTLPSGAMLNFVSGTWLALGVDLRDGVLYRPLVSEQGFGGTRYFPLWIFVHAALMRLGLSPLVAGHFISLAAAVIWIAGAYRLLQELAVPTPLARALALLTLCTSAGILALTTVRGDLLPAALNLWGLAFSVRGLRPGRSRTALALAAAFFSAAILAKVSAGFGVAAMTAALALNGHRRRAAALGGATLATSLGLLAAANVASDGRMLETMRACASAGATLWNYAHAPLTFAYTLVHQDPMSIVITILFVVAAMALPRDGWREAPTCAAVASLVMMLALDTTPGVDFNHLLDFLGCALIFVGYQMVRGRLQAPLAAAALSLAAAMSMVLFYYDIREAQRDPGRYQVSAVRSYLAELDVGTLPVFSHNPLSPAIDGRRSAMIDVVMFNLLRSRDPQFARTLEARLTRRDFGAVVLEADVQTPAGRAIVAYLFGDAFLPALTAHYELARGFAPFFVYRPKAENAAR
jgi:hypothetical protein